MQLRVLLLSVGSLAVFAAASLQSPPPKNLVADLEKVVEARLADVNTDKFGVSRMGEPYQSHKYGMGYRMKTENDVEARMVETLKSGGWNAVVYTASPRGAKRLRPFNGPVFVVDRSTDLPGAGFSGVHKDFTKRAQEVREGKISTFTYNGWKFTAKRVTAEKSCTSCHTNGKGESVKVGDTIGHLIMGFKKQSAP
jgi:hypothetical protein